MFSCPSGMKVSSSRAPPPNVTTTTLRRLRAAAPGCGKTNRAPAAVAPVTARRNSRRLQETAREASSGLAASNFGKRQRRMRHLFRAENVRPANSRCLQADAKLGPVVEWDPGMALCCNALAREAPILAHPK